MARAGEKWIVVIDGQEGKDYDDIQSLIFSPDGRRVVYQGRVGEKWIVVIDGQEGKDYDDIQSLIFSPDGQRVVYQGRVGEKRIVVLDGQEGKDYDHIWSLKFSPDAHHLAYVVRMRVGEGEEQEDLDEPGEDFAVVDGQEGETYRDVGVPVFSPDSQRVAYVARAGEKWIVVIDGQEGKDYDDIQSLIFSPDGQHLAYLAERSDSLWAIFAIWRKFTYEKFVVMDGHEHKGYLRITEKSLVFSPDSRHLAYLASRDERWAVVVDGEEQQHYYGIRPIIFFSSDSQRLAYVVHQEVGGGDGWPLDFVVVDGREFADSRDMDRDSGHPGHIETVMFDSFVERPVRDGPWSARVSGREAPRAVGC